MSACRPLMRLACRDMSLGSTRGQQQAQAYSSGPDRTQLHRAPMLVRGPLNLDKAVASPAKMRDQMPRPSSFGKDTGLQIRMATTMFLLGAVYVALGAVL